jgi:hypothetical protein
MRLSSRARSFPVAPGSKWSVITRSTGWLLKHARASETVAAVKTTNPASSNTLLRTRRGTSSLSTQRIDERAGVLITTVSRIVNGENTPVCTIVTESQNVCISLDMVSARSYKASNGMLRLCTRHFPSSCFFSPLFESRMSELVPHCSPRKHGQAHEFTCEPIA